jgi:hypothetical protein
VEIAASIKVNMLWLNRRLQAAAVANALCASEAFDLPRMDRFHLRD